MISWLMGHVAAFLRKKIDALFPVCQELNVLEDQFVAATDCPASFDWEGALEITRAPHKSGDMKEELKAC